MLGKGAAFDPRSPADPLRTQPCADLHKRPLGATFQRAHRETASAVDGGEGDPGEDQSRETFAAGSGERAGRETSLEEGCDEGSSQPKVFSACLKGTSSALMEFLRTPLRAAVPHVSGGAAENTDVSNHRLPAPMVPKTVGVPVTFGRCVFPGA